MCGLCYFILYVVIVRYRHIFAINNECCGMCHCCIFQIKSDHVRVFLAIAIDNSRKDIIMLLNLMKDNMSITDLLERAVLRYSLVSCPCCRRPVSITISKYILRRKKVWKNIERYISSVFIHFQKKKKKEKFPKL